MNRAQSTATHRTQKRSKKARKRAASPRKVGLIGRWYVIVPLTLLVLAGLIFAWYYRPLQIAYHEARNERVLGAKLKAVNEYNAQLREEIGSLETTKGVADYARRELDLIEQGEHIVVVTRDGKPVTSQESSRAAAINALDITSKPFGTWTDFFDKLFGQR